MITITCLRSPNRRQQYPQITNAWIWFACRANHAMVYPRGEQIGYGYNASGAGMYQRRSTLSLCDLNVEVPSSPAIFHDQSMFRAS